MLSNYTDNEDDDLNNDLLCNVDGFNNRFDTTYLNCELTREEIDKCICDLKHGKSAGIDNIINEYIKTTANIFLPLLFNKILNNRKEEKKILNTGDILCEWDNWFDYSYIQTEGGIKEPNNSQYR